MNANMSLVISSSSFGLCAGDRLAPEHHMCWDQSRTGKKSGSGSGFGGTSSAATLINSPDCAALERITAKVTRTQTGNFIFGAERERLLVWLTAVTHMSTSNILSFVWLVWFSTRVRHQNRQGVEEEACAHSEAAPWRAFTQRSLLFVYQFPDSCLGQCPPRFLSAIYSSHCHTAGGWGGGGGWSGCACACVWIRMDDLGRTRLQSATDTVYIQLQRTSQKYFEVGI